MDLGADLRAELVKAVAATIERHAEELTTLDQAIGDGDHGLNMKRGFEAVLADVANLSAKPWPDFLKGVGTMLVMKVGGASGPLYGTLFMGLGKDLPAEPTPRRLWCAPSAARSRRCRRAASRSAARRPCSMS